MNILVAVSFASASVKHQLSIVWNVPFWQTLLFIVFVATRWYFIKYCFSVEWDVKP